MVLEEQQLIQHLVKEILVEKLVMDKVVVAEVAQVE